METIAILTLALDWQTQCTNGRVRKFAGYVVLWSTGGSGHYRFKELRLCFLTTEMLGKLNAVKPKNQILIWRMPTWEVLAAFNLNSSLLAHTIRKSLLVRFKLVPTVANWTAATPPAPSAS